MIEFPIILAPELLMKVDIHYYNTSKYNMKPTVLSFHFFLLLLIASLIIRPGDARSQVVSFDPMLESLLAEAMANSPDLAAFRSDWEGAKQRIPQSGAWPDPVVSIGIKNLPTNTFDYNQEAMTATWLNVSQSIPLTSRYQISREMAVLGADGSRYRLSNRQLELAVKVANAWYDWGYREKAIATLDSTIDLLGQVLEIAETKYSTGKGLQQDLFRIGTEKARVTDQRSALNQLSLSSGRNLALLLGRNPTMLPEKPSQFQSEFHPLNRNELIEQLINRNPALKAMQSNLEMKRRKADLKRALWWPNLMINAGYGYRQDTNQGINRPDFFSITAGVSLPVFGADKQNPAVEEAIADAEKAAFSWTKFHLTWNTVCRY